jgi:hypothetical protein
MSNGERAFAVLTDPRFWQAEWVHYGHTGQCPHEEAWGPCRQFRVGMTLVPGRVRWLEAPTVEDAFERAAQVLLDGKPVHTMPGYQG